MVGSGQTQPPNDDFALARHRAHIVGEASKARINLVLGFQGRSQLAKRYGLDVEAMLSQPATKIFLRTSEPEAAKWISQTLGDIETERLRQSRSAGDGWASTSRHSTSYGLERQVEPLVMPSEISGLPNLRGYLKLGNLVTRLSVPFIHVTSRHQALIARADSSSAGTPRVRPTPVPAPVAETPVHELATSQTAASHGGHGAAHGHRSFD